MAKNKPQFFPASSMLKDVESLTLRFRAGTAAEIWTDLEPQRDKYQVFVKALKAELYKQPYKNVLDQIFALPRNLAIKIAAAVTHNFYDDFQAESKILADLGGICPPEMDFLQRQYSWAHAACTTTVAWDSVIQKMRMQRCLDWPAAEAIGIASRLIDFVDEDGVTHAKVAGMLGMIGVLTAIRPGFAIAINYGHGGWRNAFKRDPTFLLRKLIEDKEVFNFATAKKAVLNWDAGSPCFVTICGVDNGEGCVVEFGPTHEGEILVREMPMGGGLVQSNHYDPFGPNKKFNAGVKAAEGAPEELYGAELLETSIARRALVEHALAHRGERAIENVLTEIYETSPVWNFETAQIVTMVPIHGAIGTIKVRARRP